MAKTNEELLEEIEELNDLLKDQDKDLLDKDREIEELIEKTDDLEDEIDKLSSEIEEFPKIKGFVDQEKVDRFFENYQKFTLESFEKFLNENCK